MNRDLAQPGTFPSPPTAQDGVVAAAHTPGPWLVAGFDANGQPVVMSEHTEVATCWHHCVGSLLVQANGNARLIASAPELLEALQWTWKVLRAAGLLNLTNGVQLGQTSWYIKISDAEAASDAAIAKATSHD